MKLECVREKLAEAVSKAEKITSKNATLPILKCVLFEAQKNSLVVRSTNLDIGIEMVIPAKVQVEGVVAIPGSTINSFLAHLSGE
ncbi:MAG: DNA polymerase III subunit beta, partial [Patescibacteria group bacterium]